MEHFGHPFGAQMAQERQQDLENMKNIRFLGGSKGSKWSKNWYKKYLKIELIFVAIWKLLFLDLGSILDPKTDPK